MFQVKNRYQVLIIIESCEPICEPIEGVKLTVGVSYISFKGVLMWLNCNLGKVNLNAGQW